MNIVGKKVTLRAIEEEDLPLLAEWSNDPEIWHLLGGWHFPSSRDEIRHWFEGLKNDKKNIRLAVSTKEHGIIGTANLVEIDWKNNNASHGMMIGKTELRHQGFGRDTIMALMRYAFEELHLARLDTTIIEYNDASLGAYVGKCGWKIEGRQRGWYFRKNRYWDRILVGITREDYAALAEQTGYWKTP